MKGLGQVGERRAGQTSRGRVLGGISTRNRPLLLLPEPPLETWKRRLTPLARCLMAF